MTREVAVPFGAWTRYESHTKRYGRERPVLVGFELALFSQARNEFLTPTRDVTEQSLDVYGRHGETDSALGRVEVDVPETAHDDARLKRDTVLGQFSFERIPL